MNKSRIVIDTNVFISALLIKKSVPFQVVSTAFEQGIILYSNPTFNELKQVVFRRKFDRYLTSEERNIFLFKFANESESVEIKEEIKACRDAKDDKFLELAVNGNADLIITGDIDLLVLNPFREIEIITPEVFIARFKDIN
jgi:putative PIN family toxin of toxin-antitoxin system